MRSAPLQTRLDRRRDAGLTLIELVISIVVIGVAVTGTLLGVNAVVGRSADPMLQHQALAIAEAHLEEILGKALVDPDDGSVCPAAEASRNLYDNICDYQGLDDPDARNQEGALVPGLAGYRVRVTIDTGATLNGLAGSPDVLRADVRVNRAAFVDLTLSGYRTRY